MTKRTNWMKSEKKEKKKKSSTYLCCHGAGWVSGCDVPRSARGPLVHRALAALARERPHNCICSCQWARSGVAARRRCSWCSSWPRSPWPASWRSARPGIGMPWCSGRKEGLVADAWRYHSDFGGYSWISKESQAQQTWNPPRIESHSEKVYILQSTEKQALQLITQMDSKFIYYNNVIVLILSTS